MTTDPTPQAASGERDPAHALGRDAPKRARSPKQARSRRTRTNIVRAAIRCFEVNGYDATTTAGIAAEAGVGVGTVYSYFANKREILLEIVQETLSSMAEAVVRHLDPQQWTGGDPRETTRILIDLIFHTQDLPSGMQRIVWERYFKDPEVDRAMEGIWARSREAIKVFLDAVEQAGQLRAIDRVSATHVIQNAVQWNASRAFADGDPERIDAYAAATVDMISRFVFVDPDTASRR